MSTDNGGDNGRSATDIITYIGIPLAVLGVLPILYNTFATVASLMRIKRMLRYSRLSALTRSDVVNRVIEIELPRYAVMPLDRFQDKTDYWTTAPTWSSIPGGSWTIFNWKTNTIGVKTQRVEYADQVRQPQVDVALDELVCYLLDLGAVPDSQGWKVLRTTGLWAPVGCCLMTSPDGTDKALTVAPLHDSDGHLSLAVNWSSAWIQRGHDHLPPYWLRLPAPPPASGQQDAAAVEAAENGNESDTKNRDRKVEELDDTASASASASGERAPTIADSIDRQARSNERSDLTCQIGIAGLVTALNSNDAYYIDDVAAPPSLYTDHLRVSSTRSTGTWFASAATAYGTSRQTVLWNFKIPDDILAFSRRDTMPCGVLVLLGMVDESETPEWATKFDDSAADMDKLRQRSNDRHEAFLVESKMSPQQRSQATTERMLRESRQMMLDMRERARREDQRRDQRMLEALQSPRWDAKRVAERALHWLDKNEIWDSSQHTAKDIVGFVLHRMVLDGQFASSISAMLDAWKGWAEMGGMKRADFESLKETQALFAQAALLAALIKDTSDDLEGTLATDLQECLRMWKIVRLG